MTKLKLALLGVGDVAQRDYLPEFHRLADRAKLVAACGRGPDRVRAVADAYRIPARYTDLHQMLAETDADAVLNLTPIQLHAETTLACLRAGKHVYTEKPVAGSVAAAERLRDEARRRGLTIVCAPAVLLYPQLRLVRRLLDQDAIGPVHAARGLGFGGVPPWSGYPSDPTPFFAAGGGPLVDMGVYPLHALTGLLGPARRVTALSAQAQRGFVPPDGPAAGARVPIAVPDAWMIVLDLGHERLVSIEANNVARGSRAPQMELLGLRGSLAVNLLDVSAPIERLDADGAWRTIPVPHVRAAGPDHLLGVEHLVDSVTADQPPLLSVDHAIHVLEIIDGASRSAATGRTISLDSGFDPAPAASSLPSADMRI